MFHVLVARVGGAGVATGIAFDVRGCTTASLQSTAMAERLYGGLGFRDLGRILEYAPSLDGKARDAGRGLPGNIGH